MTNLLDAEVADLFSGDQSTEGDKPKSSTAAILVDLAMQRYRFGVTETGEPFAVPITGGHVARMLRGGRASLRADLAAAYRQRSGKIAAQQALADALMALEGEAQAVDPTSLHLRVAEAGGAVWVDLGDATERVVVITPGGWSVVDHAPVLFRRTALTGPLPVPVSGGDLSELWDLINVAASDRPLVLAWLIAALLRPTIPHPILGVFGEQGSGKSTGSQTLVRLVDPSPVPLRKPPRDADGWVTAAAGSWIVGIDNLSTVPDWLSDSFCRAVTGDGDVRRQLYTDGGLAVFAFRRVLLLNGIDVGAMRGDLAERMIMVNLHRITERARLTETQLDRRWTDAYPRLFGALLDLAGGVAAILPSVRLDSAPRMADFAEVLAAVDQVLDSDGLAQYAKQAQTMAEDSLNSDPFLAALRSDLPGLFTGTAADLLSKITPTADGWRPPRDWPKNARQVTTRLRRNAPALRKAGWSVEDQGTANKDGVTRWQVTPPTEKVGTDSPPSPLSPPSLVNSQFDGGDSGGEPGSRTPPSPPANGALTRDDGEAGKAGKDYGQSQDDTAPLLPNGRPKPCDHCGDPLSGPPLNPTSRCSNRHRTAA